MKNITRKIKELDRFGKPVALAYQGKKAYTTLVGGCFSITLMLAFGAYAIYEMHRLLVNPNYTPGVTSYKY